MMTVRSAMAPFVLPSAVSRPIVYPAGGGLLIVGGLTAADRTTQAILKVDLTGATVQPAGRLPVPVHDAGGAVVGGRDLLFGGGSTAVTSAVQDVTPGTSPRVVSHLPQPRADLVAIGDGNTGYVLGGFDGAQGSTTILRTRDGRTFTVVGSLPVTVRYPAVAVGDGSIWLFGGEHAGKQVSDVQRIDLATGHGNVAGRLPRPLAHAGAFTLAGAIFLAGGRTGDTETDTVMRFDPATVRFSAAGHLPAARSDFGVAVVAGIAYLVGGENPKPLDTVIEVRASAGGTP
jgi:Kelch motif